MTHCANPECGKRLDPERVKRRNAKYCEGNACRSRAHKLKHGLAEPRPERLENGSRGGVQLSYRKAVRAVEGAKAQESATLFDPGDRRPWEDAA